MTKRREINSECWSCRHRRDIPGDYHIACANPDIHMTGHHHGIAHGWFIYPINFDPVWKTKLCVNYEEVAGEKGS